jgi:hypothetical protein
MPNSTRTHLRRITRPRCIRASALRPRRLDRWPRRSIASNTCSAVGASDHTLRPRFWRALSPRRYLSVDSGSHGSPERQSAIAPVHRSNRCVRPGPATEICQCRVIRIGNAIKMPAMTMEIGVDMRRVSGRDPLPPRISLSRVAARLFRVRFFSFRPARRR